VLGMVVWEWGQCGGGGLEGSHVRDESKRVCRIDGGAIGETIAKRETSLSHWCQNAAADVNSTLPPSRLAIATATRGGDRIRPQLAIGASCMCMQHAHGLELACDREKRIRSRSRVYRVHQDRPEPGVQRRSNLEQCDDSADVLSSGVIVALSLICPSVSIHP
jgi:hypothetical protein